MSMPEYEPPEREGDHDPLSSLGRVAGELIHDMANLVATLEGRVRLALGDARAGRVPVGDLERAVDGCSDLASMIRDVLASLREEELSPEVVVHPEPLVERAIRRTLDICSPVEIRLVSDLPTGLAVRGRGSFVYRAAANLLANAARHALSKIRVVLTLTPDGRQVSLSVEDDGPGIAPEQREAVFRPLVRGASGGTGLGLSSVAWTVAQLGGEIRYATGTVLGGARFEILLPVAAPFAVLPQPPRSLTGRSILLVDDNADVRRALGRYLRRLGAEVAEVGTAWETEEQLIHMVIRSIPDALVLDLNLGLRTGLDVWSVLHDQIPLVARRVVFVSGLGPGDPLYDEARRTGQPVLPKPFDLNELTSTLEAVFRAG